ncbi:glutamate--cysteine ligase [Caldimonas thermodepolymerans]|jgi:glutamate--cysteine ligase, T. ferrooxidans family|uniref:Glutamate--cysteine ligase n=1 Tax=Caldimonas thermodepolymerans TaxID=215580 RepID=A0A2S5T7Z0_9BURK|nr:glutamate--cysteine ligase [Caldimonas thermodepolymerans]PPE70998.1 glutamate--cysteine ligase [Caldimonas thermodepolymerans]QPC31298.1 glutamate--cysteine ligase [Caldimonas thermodepolymerans]RDH99738.1 glutamate--cysteine ligase [Caldimonas thermodepolymerans]TCP07536.1 glutamate--cysteine ligase [Caldimonas thermodepolymerans]UZG44042.1 glutamate--cysteine ligase [Caldimonas thermodepolymerans]
MVPHLITALTGPINELEQRILESMPAIERWFRLEWMEHTPPFYSSVDVRNAGFKLAPVDTNLFPGGFNNLTEEMLPLAVQAAMAAIEKICPEAKNLLLIPEKHTRNTFYLMNVQRLVQIFHQAGLNVRLGTLDETIKEPTTLTLPDGSTLTVEPLVRSKRRLGLKDFDPCTILLNNDLSAGLPPVLEGLHEQYLLPPLHAGWAVRRKSNHFQAYEEVAKKFAKLLGMDPWLINPMFAKCGQVNFAESVGIDCLQSNADALLSKIRRKYKEYGIQEKPFVIIKADAGTYGMGIMTVRDAKELAELNRKTRNKMSVIKDGQTVSEVIIQEGVPTYERINEAVAEPVVYMIDRYVVGGFYRVHAERGIDENLNAPGASFVPLAFAETNHLPKPGAKPGASAPNRFYMYGVIARLAMLAASYELEATDPDAEVYD